MYPLLRKLLFLLGAEEAHDLAAEQMARLQNIPSMLAWLESHYASTSTVSPRTLWGLHFPNPLGIAAGFDKNAEVVPFLSALGFGFVEVGTVTLHPQKGNPKPRIFRFPHRTALINRLGFNNDGAATVAGRLESLWNTVEQRGTFQPPVLVNIGKNVDVGLEEAPAAFEACFRIVAPFGHGIVVNVSSPNTPGLRDLQAPSHLRDILRRLRRARAETRFATAGEHPILVKIAPDLTNEQLGDIAAVALELADGMVATNTTLDRTTLPEGKDQTGGLSGSPLFERSTRILRLLRQLVGPAYPLIGVGGILTGRDAAEKLAAGADLIQAYTGFVYGGPSFPRNILRALSEHGLRPPGPSTVNRQPS